MTWMKRLAAAVGLVALAGAGLLATTTTVLAWTTPPVLTPVCTSSAGTYTFAVSGSENDYNVTVDQSASSSFASGVTVSSFTSKAQPYDFVVSQSNGEYVKAEWTTDDSAGFGTPATGNAGCSTPTTTTTATQVKDANGDVSSSVSSGDTVWDTATVVSEANGIVPTGTVTYSFFDNGSCTSTAASTQAVTLSDGVVPPSASETLTAGGSYSFDAVYNGDVNDTGSTSSCEPFSVATGGVGGVRTTTTATQVKDANGDVSSGGTVSSGDTVWDTATVVSEANGIVPTGTVTYSFFDNGSCTSTAASTQAVTLSDGVVPPSASETLTAGGSYSFDAVYSGDSNYSGSPSSCEPFSVATGGVGGARTTTTATPTTPTTGAVSAASTATPTTGADLFLPGLLAAFASLFGGLLLMAGVRLRRRPTV